MNNVSEDKPVVTDLRSALQFLVAIPGELVGTDVDVDPDAELSGVYRHVGAGDTCLRPTRKGPAMLFNKVKGFENFRIAIGILSTRQRVGRLLGCAPERRGFLLKDSVRNPIPPVVVGPEKAQCQEIVHLASDPAIEIAACFEPPTTPQGFDELQIAGAIRGRPVELSRCLTINERAIAHAEIVIEGELLPNVRVREDQNTDTGKAMPEFPGYTGEAKAALPVIKVKAVTHRRNPILQTTIGPSEEHVNLAGIPTEASILDMVGRAMPGRLQNVYAHSSGGGKFLSVLQFSKASPVDEGRQRQAALLAFSSFPELNIRAMSARFSFRVCAAIRWTRRRRRGSARRSCKPACRARPSSTAPCLST